MPGKQEPTDRRRIRPLGDASRKGLSLFLGGAISLRSESSIPRKGPGVPSGVPRQVVAERTYYCRDMRELVAGIGNAEQSEEECTP